MAQGAVVASSIQAAGRAERCGAGACRLLVALQTVRLSNATHQARSRKAARYDLSCATLISRQRSASSMRSMPTRARRYGSPAAREQDLRTVLLNKPPSVSPARFVSEIGELNTQVDMPARVVVDERTGTVVIGSNVRISTVAVSHGTLTVRVTESQTVSQPNPFSEGQTVVSPETMVTIEEKDGKVAGAERGQA